MVVAVRISSLVLVFAGLSPQAAIAQADDTAGRLEQLVPAAVWGTPEAAREAMAELRANPSYHGVTRQAIEDVERLLRAGRPGRSAQTSGGRTRRDTIDVEVRGVRIPVFVQLPSSYNAGRAWPLLLAMHGGPPGSVEGALGGAERMIDVWVEAADSGGWIVASPAMVTVVAQDGRTQERLPYEIFHPEQAAAVLTAVRARYHVDPNSIVSTGISLGSNFSIAFAGAHPDWFSGIVPVSTEGESRELLLRNLLTVPTYVLEGTQDRNIRGVDGPRALAEIMESFGYDIVYREFSDRAHEGFQEHYGDVLMWLADRPRDGFPVELVRVPHSGIVPLSRRIYWLETDTRQAVVRAAVRDGNRIDVVARWVGEITLYLHDGLVDLDRPVEIWVNGVLQYDGQVARSIPDALQRVRQLADESRVYPAAVTVQVPRGGAASARARQLTDVDLAPRRVPGTLSFWEMYAVRALEERYPDVGFAATEVALPAQTAGRPEQVGLRVTEVDRDGAFGVAGLEVGDVVIEVGGEPFFEGRRGVAGLRAWLMRELRSEALDYRVTVVRRGELRSITVSLALGPYAGPAGPAR